MDEKLAEKEAEYQKLKAKQAELQQQVDTIEYQLRDMEFEIHELHYCKGATLRWDAFKKGAITAMLKNGLYSGEECQFVNSSEPMTFTVKTLGKQQLVKIKRTEDFCYIVNDEDKARTGFYLFHL